MKKSINPRGFALVPVTMLCVCSGLVGAAMFYWLVKPSQTIIEQVRYEARLAAEHELQWGVVNRSPSVRIKATLPSDFISAAETSKRSVVFVRALSLTDKSTVFNKIYNSSSGSGVLISRDGYIVTNKHVIDGADKVEIILNDKREFLAKVIGTDIATDLAVVKIEVDDAPFLPFGDSDALQVGEWVLAVGNPFKLSSTVTAGIVSAKARTIDVMGSEGIESFIQTDAAVNPGNSGGALINTQGKLIGINTAILTKSGGYEGFSFAVPINLARKVIADIKEYGAVQRGWMGVHVNDVDAAIAADIQLKEISGVLLSGFTQTSAAKQAGMVIGDVVTGINGIKVHSVPEFMEQIGRYRPGDAIEVSFLRDNLEKTASITLKNNINGTAYIGIRKDKILTNLGFELRDMDTEEKALLDLQGAYVVSVYQNSIVGKTNLEPGFIVTLANGQVIESAQALISFLETAKGTIVLEGFYENYPGRYPYTFEMP